MDAGLTARGAGTAKWPAGLPAVLRLEGRNTAPLPLRFAAQDVRFTEQLVAIFVERLTARGDAVLDPFAGFGTTPIVAESMGREGWGVEVDPQRVAYIRGHVAAADRILAADARALATLAVPPIALVVTSPPFSAPGDPLEALSGYRGRNPGYVAYLFGLREVFREVRALLAPDGWVVIEAADLRRSDEVTPLPRDVAPPWARCCRSPARSPWSGTRRCEVTTAAASACCSRPGRIDGAVRAPIGARWDGQVATARTANRPTVERPSGHRPPNEPGARRSLYASPPSSGGGGWRRDQCHQLISAPRIRMFVIRYSHTSSSTSPPNARRASSWSEKRR